MEDILRRRGHHHDSSRISATVSSKRSWALRLLVFTAFTAFKANPPGSVKARRSGGLGLPGRELHERTRGPGLGEGPSSFRGEGGNGRDQHRGRSGGQLGGSTLEVLCPRARRMGVLEDGGAGDEDWYWTPSREPSKCALRAEKRMFRRKTHADDILADFCSFPM